MRLQELEPSIFQLRISTSMARVPPLTLHVTRQTSLIACSTPTLEAQYGLS